MERSLTRLWERKSRFDPPKKIKGLVPSPSTDIRFSPASGGTRFRKGEKSHRLIKRKSYSWSNRDAGREAAIYLRPSRRKVLTSDRLPAALLLPINYPSSTLTKGQRANTDHGVKFANARPRLASNYAIRVDLRVACRFDTFPTAIISLKISRSIIIRTQSWEN